MSLYKMPMAIMENLDCIIRNVLWEGHVEENKLLLMQWSEAIRPK